jgi:stress response protein YsnF
MTDSKKAVNPAPSPSATPMNVTAVEQRLRVNVAERETATVRVRTIVHKELTEIPVVLRRRVVTIEHVPANRFVESEFEPFRDGDVLIVPVFEYVPVTEMKLMLKEEVRIGFEETEEASVHEAEVQRQELVVERRTGTDGDWIAQPAPPSSEDGEQSAF